MKTLFIVVTVLFYVFSVAENSLRLRDVKDSLALHRRKSDGNLRPNVKPWDRKRARAMKNIYGKRSSKKKFKKSQHYIDPKILKQLNGVKDFNDFVKKFKPKGFTVRKEKKFIKKVAKDKGGTVIGIGRIPDKSDGLLGGLPGAVIKNDVYEEVQTEVVYFEGQRVADPLQSSSISQTDCIPRDTPHSIARLGAVSYPSCVILRKCGGCCKAGMECVSTATVNKTIPVVEYTGVAGWKQIQKTFTDDATCGCDCIVKASDCLPRQTYSKQNCQCECNLPQEVCPTGRHWLKAECGCICSNRQDCTSPLRKWDESTCNCECIDTPCPTEQTRNSENCLCS